MTLQKCADCGSVVSSRAASCPNCGCPVGIPAEAEASASLVDRRGAWCPNCRNRDSYKKTSGIGCAFAVFIVISMGLALIMLPFLPKTWHCRICGNEWRA